MACARWAQGALALEAGAEDLEQLLVLGAEGPLEAVAEDLEQLLALGAEDLELLEAGAEDLGAEDLELLEELLVQLVGVVEEGY